MRIILFHNPSAGRGAHVVEELLVGLKRAGHEVHQGTLDDADLDICLRDPGCVIAVAGGDGTVRRIALKLVGRRVPIAILPLGTANNVASALGLPREPRDMIRQLESMVPWKYDVGRVNGPWGQSLFLEGTGFGPFVRTGLLLSNPSQQEVFNHPDEKLTRDRQLLEQMVRNYAVQACEVVLDDETLVEKCLAVHIMNLATVGPNLRMAPGADPGDGELDVVLVRDEDRREFADFVADQRAGGHAEARFPVHRSRRVRLRWQGAEVHVDDEFHQTGEAGELCAEVMPGELLFLRPPPHERATAR
jgi:diacylglycerol kinase family enzyme